MVAVCRRENKTCQSAEDSFSPVSVAVLFSRPVLEAEALFVHVFGEGCSVHHSLSGSFLFPGCPVLFGIRALSAKKDF